LRNNSDGGCFSVKIKTSDLEILFYFFLEKRREEWSTNPLKYKAIEHYGMQLAKYEA
jgi:hypothetical protein